ncbi:MAG: methionyl-tRNA formyltransferase [Bacteroidetes bacterium]|nr:methionyl-tRNA formyltransferase [Bacteroidota bacterium]
MKKEDLRIIFMGTPDFSVPTLNAIITEGYNVVGVITAPDREAGRGRKIKMSAVKEFALKNELKILQPTNLKDEGFIKELTSLKPNLQIVVAFRMLPKVVWSLPKLGTFNLHASLLPQFRGAAPINFAIINGESQTGLTTFFLDEQIDTGRIIKQIKTNISSDDSAGSLHDKMMVLGSELVIDTINCILNNSITPMDQKSFIDQKEVLYSAPKLNKEDCRINWNKKPDEVYNFVRGLSPYPASFSTLVSKRKKEIIVKIFSVSIISSSENNQNPGTIISDGSTYIDVALKSGIIRILELQLSGKKRMKTDELLRGFKNIQDYHFE